VPSVPIYQKDNKTECNNYTGVSIFINYVHNFIHHLAVKVTPQEEKITKISTGNFNLTAHLQIIHSALVTYLNK
jgi:hypothetical protein